MNDRLDLIAPSIEKKATEKQAREGLLKLEELVNYSAEKTIAIYDKYPRLTSEADKGEKVLLPKFIKLSRQMLVISNSVDYWEKRLKNDMDVQRRIAHIRQKVKETNQTTQRR